MDWLLLSNVLYQDLRLPQSCRGAVRGEKLFSLSLQTFVFIRPFFVFLVEIMRLWTSKFGLLYSVIINLEQNAKVDFLKFKHLKCRLRIFQFGHFRVKCYICLFPFLLKTLIPARCRCGFVYMDIFCVFWPIVIASTSRTRDQANAVWQNPQTQRRLESFLCINFTFLLCHKHTNIVLKPTSFRPQYCRISPLKILSTAGVKRVHWGYLGRGELTLLHLLPPQFLLCYSGWRFMEKNGEMVFCSCKSIRNSMFRWLNNVLFFGAALTQLGWTLQSSFLTPLHYS